MQEAAHDRQAGNAGPPLRSLEGELMLLVAGQARRVPIPVAVTTALMALLMADYVQGIYPLLWVAVVYVATWFHTRLILSLPADTTRSEDRKLTVAAWSFALHGAALTALLLFFPFVPITIGAIITVNIIAICAATLHATAGFLRIYLPYCVVTVGATALMWAFSPGLGIPVGERVLFVVLALVFFATMIGHAKGGYAVFLDSYAIRLQREELNRALREALIQAESANRAKTRFLASASHDLRQPIHALSLFSGSLLLRKMEPRTAAIAEQIDKAVRVLASQLDALLDVSRLDAGVIEKSIATVDFKPLLEQLGSEFRPLAERKGLQLQVRAGDDCHVRTDAMLVQRVLGNLVSNAVKYTESGSVELVAQRSGKVCRVAVRDTGCGIAREEHDRVFEEFYQLENPERDRAKGLGLGLAIVQRLCRLLNLQLRMDSTPGLGTVFTLDLPLATRLDTPVLVPPEPEEPVLHRLRVLVVDDEEDVRLGMQTLLEEMGFCVRVAASTEAAIDCTHQFEPAVVLADFRLRGADTGLHTVRALRQVWPGLPALLVSGDTAPDRLRECRDAGVELLHKPVAAALLRDSILRVTAA